MDTTMAIATMSMDLSAYKTQQAVQISLLKKAMNTGEANAKQLIENIKTAVPAPSEYLLDVRV